MTCIDEKNGEEFCGAHELPPDQFDLYMEVSCEETANTFELAFCKAIEIWHDCMNSEGDL